jgi:hypothetical protein
MRQGGFVKVRNQSAVGGREPRTVTVEEPDDPCVEPARTRGDRNSGFAEAFALVVAGSFADRIHVSKIGFRLRVDERIAINLRRRRVEKASPVLEGELDEGHRAEPVDRQRFPRMGAVCIRACGGSEVIDA